MSELFSPEEHARLEAAVADAEARTGAEVVLMVVRASTDGRAIEAILAAAAALAVPAVLLPFAGVSALVIWLVQLAAFAGLFVLARAVGLGVRLTPRAVREAQVRAAAQAQFFAHGLQGTRARAAVLIFVSMAEREAQVLWDEAAGRAVGPAEWRGVAGELARGIRTDRVRALEGAASRAGDLLAAHFPPAEDDTNALPDVIVE